MASSVTGGDKLAEVLAKYGDQLGKETLRAGFLENATYPDGESVATIAAADEFGRPENNQLPRPFFRQAIAAHRDRWSRGIGNLMKQGIDPGQALRLTGEVMKSDIQDSIRSLISPPLAPYTVKKKGFDKPLIDSSVMLGAVDYDIQEAGGDGS